MDTKDPAANTGKPDPNKEYSFPKELVLKYDKAPIDDLKEAINNQTISQQNAKVGSDQHYREQINGQTTANRYTLYGIIVNGCLTLITAGVFICTAYSLWLTRQDVKDAQKQFEISNRPFVEIGDFRVDSVQAGKKPVIKFNFYNSGKFPAKIVFCSYGLQQGNGTETKEAVTKLEEVDPNKITDSPRIILSSLPILMPREVTEGDTISKGQAENMRKGTRLYYLFIEAKYINFLTNERYFKKETFKISAGPSSAINIIDENEGTF